MTKGDSRETQMFCCCGSGCGAVADRLRQRSCSRCPEASQSGAAAAVQTAQKERITDQWSLEKTVRGEMIGVMKLSIHVPQLVCDGPEAAALNEELAAMYVAESSSSASSRRT